MQEVVTIARALSDPARVRIVSGLREQQRFVGEFAADLRLAPSTVSKHVSILRDAGLVRTTREGRWVRCRLADDDDASPLARAAIGLVLQEEPGGMAAPRGPVVVTAPRRIARR